VRALRRSSTKKPGFVGSIAVVCASVAVAIYMVALSDRRSGTGGLTAVETALFNILILLLGLSGSYFFGKVSSQLPNARSAFRRLVSLYRSLSRFLETIEDRRQLLRSEAIDGRLSLERALDTLHLLETQITEQLQTVDDAVADWQDVAPDSIADLVHQLKARKEAST
jgi:hypothetical protein